MPATDMKREVRRAKVYLLHLQGKTKRSIAETLKISESTVDRDLEVAWEELKYKEINYEEIIKEALNSLRTVKVLLLDTYQEAEGKQWTKARILGIIKDIDVKILERVAQPPRVGKQLNIQMIRQDAMTVVGYITQHHPELMPEFKEYLKKEQRERKGIPLAKVLT